jgi:hypothetical protein
VHQAQVPAGYTAHQAQAPAGYTAHQAQAPAGYTAGEVSLFPVLSISQLVVWESHSLWFTLELQREQHLCSAKWWVFRAQGRAAAHVGQ